MRIIVSLTSYPPRINGVHKVVESLYRQSVKADEIVLYLSLEEFPEAEEDLPATLKALIGKGGFRVAWVHGNLKSHKKYYYALQEYRDAVVITVDDDTMYAKTMIGELVAGHKRFPGAVSARNVRIILKKGQTLEPYRRWEREDCLEDQPRMDLCAIGNGGICYPAVHHERWFDQEMIMKMAQDQDDLWLKYNQIMDDIPVVYTKPSQKDITIEDSQRSSLAADNLRGTGNDRCIAALSALCRQQDAGRCQKWFRNLLTWEAYTTAKKRYYAGIYGAVLDGVGNLPVYFYGAGEIARYLLRILADLGLTERLEAVLVTDRSGNPARLYGLPVRALSELEAGRAFGVILGVSETKKKEIMDGLAEYHYKTVELDLQVIIRYYPECFFTARENMTSVYESVAISDLPNMAYHHFMSCENEVLYLMEEGRLAGVLSIGDLERFYRRQEDRFTINQNFTSLSMVDYDKAAAFFERSLTINEIPVVTQQGEFLGVIKKEKKPFLRKRQRRMLRAARLGEYRWRREEVKRFVKETKADVFLYIFSQEKVMQQLSGTERQKIMRHASKMDGNSKWSILSDQEWETFLGSGEKNGVAVLRKERESCQPVVTNGRTVFPDMEGDYCTIRNGYRSTPNLPPAADRRIFMFGPCFVFGAYCRDDQTIEAYLQDLLNRDGYTLWKVLNRGLCSGELCYDQMFMEELSRDDIVIIIGTERYIPKETGGAVAFQGDLSEVFLTIPHLSDCVLDSILHCNYMVNEKLAQRIYADICSTGILEKPGKPGLPEKIQEYYINWSIREYFMEYFQRYGLCQMPGNRKTGAIIMNCNPFTKGHRYLIEQAVKMVDKLYIFVVEEDRSCFKFQDRLRMVEQGVSDLSGDIMVIPSGRYMISLETFAQYFDKEQVQTVDSMDYDVYIFGEIVAAELGIGYRFVGEEPFDEVTRAYNETMKRILPDFGVEVIEFPRAAFDEKEMISATRVRKAIQEEDMEMLEKLCPQSTIAYLKEHFMQFMK